MEKSVDIGAASKILGRSRTSLQKLADSGAIAAVKTVGGHRPRAGAVVKAAQQQAGSTAVLQPAGAPAKCGSCALTVLLAEDDGAAAALVARLLGDCCPGVNLLRAGNGLEAMRLLERNRPYILLTDLNMAPLDGFELLQRVAGRPEHQSVARVAMSSMSAPEIEQRGGLAPDVLFLPKPLNLQRLRGFIEAHVQIHAASARRAVRRNKASAP